MAINLPKFPIILQFFKPVKIDACCKAHSVQQTEESVKRVDIDAEAFLRLEQVVRNKVLQYMHDTGHEPIGLLMDPTDFATCWAFVAEMGTVIDAKRKIFTIRIFAACGDMPVYLKPSGDMQVIADPQDINRLYFL